jgi:hypothetical protein
MFGLLKGLVETVVKTAVVLPVSVVADVVTLGGELNDKGGQTYCGDALDSISRSIKEMTDD